MHVRLIVLALALFAGWGLPGSALAQSPQAVPPLKSRVTDQTGTLSDAQRQQLEAALAAIEQRKGAQVAILLVPTTQPEAIEDYSIRVVEAWKLGRAEVGGKRVDDGVLILVAKNDRRMRIEVGYGLEGAIPDALAKRIVAEQMAPRFRQGDFFGGLQAAVADVGRLIEGEALPAPWQPGHGEEAAGGADWLAVGLFVLVLGFVATAVLGRLLGSMAGGAGVGVLSAMKGAPLLLAGGLGLIAFLFFLVFASASSGRMRPVGRGGSRHGPIIWTGGGWGRGGGSGGGGGGWGGGGGGFGGGGASGSW